VTVALQVPTIGWVAGTAAVAFAIRAVIGATFQRSSYVFPDPLPFHVGSVALAGGAVVLWAHS
jgi:hypothetical protein